MLCKCIRFVFVGLAFLACPLADGHQYPGQAEGPSLRIAPSDLPPPPTAGDLASGKLSTSAAAINKGLRTLYLFISQNGDRSLDWPEMSRELNVRLASLTEFDAAIGKLSSSKYDQIVRKSVLNSRAQAFLYGWSAFSLVTDAVSRRDASPDRRTALLAMGTDPGGRSCLANLLILHRQIVSAGQDRPATLRALLGDVGLLESEGFAYRHGWNDKEKPGDFRHDYYIPSDSDLVGSPDDPTVPCRQLLSLWALVNLQLDTWNDWAGADPAAPPQIAGLSGLIGWLDALEGQKDLESFDASNDAVRSFRSKVKKLRQFLTFRQRAADERALSALLKSISEDRAKKPEEQRGPRAFVPELVEAAEAPPGGGYLADAAIWLRYVVLLSYQGEGWLVLGRGGQNDLGPYWVRHGLPQGQFDLARGQARGPSMLRWGGWPASGHAADVLAGLAATARSFLKLQADIVQLEGQRYEPGLDYSGRLGALLDNFEKGAGWGGRPVGPSRDAPTIRGQLRQSPGRAWCRSVTAGEEARLVEDLFQLEGRIGTCLQHQRLVLQMAERGDGSRAGGVLASLTAFPELADCNLESPISATFEMHVRRIREIHEEIRQNLEDDRSAKRLLREMEVRQFQAGTADTEERAAILAFQAAGQSLEMARIFERIAQLDKQIRALNQQAAGAWLNSYKSAEQAAGVRLALATRARDLAAAQLAALNAALDQAKSLIDSTQEGLRKTQAELLTRADDIEKEKKRAFVIGLIKAAIRIVGAALAPFTGGASMAIAQAATMAVDLAANAERMNWGNIGEIARNVGTIAESGVQIATSVINVVGSEKLKQGWVDIQGQYAKVKGRIGDLTNEAKQLLNGLADSKDIQTVVTAVSAAASGWPVAYRNGTLCFDVQSLTKIRIDDPELRMALDGVMKSGGIFVNDMGARVGRLSQLPLLENEALRSELGKALDDLIQVAPNEVLEKYREANIQISNVENQLRQAKDRLKGLLDGPGKEIQRQLLARIMASGMILVTDKDGRVVAIERPVKEELRALKGRAEALQRQVIEGAIGKVVRAIEEKSQQLTTQIEAAEKAQDQDQLRQIATVQVPAVIDLIRGDPDKNVRGELDKLRDAISEAQGELEDKQSSLDAAKLQQAAAQFAIDAAKFTLEAARLEVQNSLNYEQLGQARLQRDQLLLDEKRQLLEAKERQKRLAAIVLRHARDECMDHGIDPTSQGTAGFKAAPFATDGTRLSGAIFRSRDSDIRSRLLLRNLAAEFVGMLKWVYLLGLRIPEDNSDPLDAIGWYSKMIKELAKDNIAAEHADVIQKWAGSVAARFRKQAPAAASVISQTVESTQTRVRYFGGMDEVGADPWLGMQSERLRRQAIARIDFWVTNQPTDIEAVNPQTESDDLLAISSAIEIVRVGEGVPVSTLRFTIRPPEAAAPYPGRSEVQSASVRRDAPVTPNAALLSVEKIIGASFMKDWDINPAFTGFYGQWTVYLFDTAYQQGDRIESPGSDLRPRLANFRDHLKLDVWVPLVRVRR